MKQRVVIAGLGDTGLLAAIHLPKCYEIIGISPKPCLVSGQELGTRITRPAQWKRNYLMGFDRYRHLHGVQTIHGSVTGIAPGRNRLSLRDATGQERQLHYDVLLIATGVSNGFWRNSHQESMDEIHAGLADVHEAVRNAQRIAVVGGGTTAVSSASNIKETFPDKQVHLFCSREQPLPEYHPKTRNAVEAIIRRQGIVMHPGHRAHLPDDWQAAPLGRGSLRFGNQSTEFEADLILWAVGNLQPNNTGLPDAFLNGQGFVKADTYLRVPGFQNVFTVGDIAATDPNRCSARNKGFRIVAHNIDVQLRGRGRLRAFKPATYRWGSVLGVRNEGMRVFTPQGGNVRINRWTVDRLLFPLAVHRMIYKGVRPD